MIDLIILINKHLIVIFALLLFWVQVTFENIKERKLFLNSIWIVVEVLIFDNCIVRYEKWLIYFLFKYLSLNVIERVINFNLVCFWWLVSRKSLSLLFILRKFFIFQFKILLYLIFLGFEHIFFIDFAEWAEVIEFLLIPAFIG